ncbi:MAG: ATP-binding cassette domain-containing protein [Raoultibacter sp.]
MSDTVIETKELTKRYGKARGITDVNLCVPRGDIFGFIGPNGAGKSTCIRTLLGLIKATSGEAYVLGKPCGPSAKELLADVGSHRIFSTPAKKRLRGGSKAPLRSLGP